MHKSIQVLILIFTLTLLELFTSNNTVVFSIIKASGIIFLIGMVKTIIKQYKLKHVLPIAIVLLLIPSVYAVDIPIYNPTCMSPSYDVGYSVLTTSNTATMGEIVSRNIGADGYFSISNQRVYDGINILCAVSDPTTAGTISGEQRIFGTSEDGSVWYTDSPNLNYSLGFYSPGYLGCGIDGNCNDLRKIGALSATTLSRKMAIDSVGNVYTIQGTTIKRYVKSLAYSEQTVYTLIDGIDYDAMDGTGTNTIEVSGLAIDQLDRIHVLVVPSVGGAGAHSGYITHSVINSAGAHISADLTLFQCGGSGVSGCVGGGIVLDSINPSHNYTYAYYSINNGEGYIYHNSTIGTVNIGGAITTVTSITDLAYYNFQLYILGAPNLIRSYVTNFMGQTPGIVGGGPPADLTYDISTITSEQTTYANNSVITLYTNIVFTTSILDTGNVNNYRWKTELNDPSGLMIASHFSEYCNKPFFSLTCSLNETLNINPPVTNWTAGTYTAYLKEYNVNSFALATLDRVTFTVLNTSLNNTGITITTPITSGTGTTTLGQWDEYVSFLGWGVNPISRLFFALMIITIVGLIGMKLAGGDAAMVGAFAPYIFFTYIEFIPKWIFIILVLMLVLKSKIFR